MAERDQSRVIASHGVDGPSPQSPNHPQESCHAINARAPAELIARESNAGGIGQVIAIVLAAHHLLDQNGHPLIVINQPHAAPIEQNVWTVHAGVDLADGRNQFAQVFLWGPLVGAKIALVFAGKRCAK